MPTALVLPGTAGNYASAPDSAALSITSDITILCRVALADWTPLSSQTLVAKNVSTGNQRSYILNVDDTGVLGLYLSQAGTALVGATSSVAPTIADGADLWVLASWRNSDNRVQFFTAAGSIANPAASDFAQLGTDQSIALTGIFNSTAPLEVGSFDAGASQAAAGKFYRAKIYDGVFSTGGFGGTLKFDADFASVVPTAVRTPASFTESSANAATVTENGTTWAWLSVVALTSATVAFSGVALDPVPQPVAVALTPATIASSAVVLNPVPQPVTVALTPASFSLVAVPVTIPGGVTPSPFPLLTAPATNVDFDDATVDFDSASTWFDGQAVEWPLLEQQVAFHNDVTDGDPYDELVQTANTVLRRASCGALYRLAGDWVEDGTGLARLLQPSQRLVIADTFRATAPAGTTINGRVDQLGNRLTLHTGTATHGSATIGSQQRTNTSAGPMVATWDAGTPDGTCSTIWWNSGAFNLFGGLACGIVLRFVDLNNYLRVEMTGGNTIRLVSVAGGVVTTLNSPALAANFLQWATNTQENECWLRVDIRNRRVRVNYAKMHNSVITPNIATSTVEQTDVQVLDYTMTAGEAAATATGTRFGIYQSSNPANVGFIAFHMHADAESLAILNGPSSGVITTNFDVAQDGHAFLFRYLNPRNFWYVEQREANAGVVDPFTRGDSAVAPGGTWTVQSGTAGISTNRLYFPIAGTVYQNAVSDGVVKATAAVMVADMSLKFRQTTSIDYWEVTAVPAFGVWNLNYYVNGVQQFVTNTPGSGCANGDIVEVRLDGPRIQVYINNVLRATTHNPLYQRAPLVGLSAPTNVARWDDFSATTTAGLRLLQRLNDVDTVIDTWDGAPAGDVEITLLDDDIEVRINTMLVLDTVDADLQTAAGVGYRGLRGEGAGRFGPINCELAWETIPAVDVYSENIDVVRGIPFDIGNVDPATLTTQWHNRHRRYDQTNTASDLYGLLQRWRPIRWLATTLQAPRAIYRGFIDRYQQTWPSVGVDVQVPIECTDAAGVARQTNMRNPYPDLVAIDRPVAYVRLRDQDPTLSIVDESGHSLATSGVPGGYGTTDQILNGDAGIAYASPPLQFATPNSILPLGRQSFAVSLMYEGDYDAASIGTFLQIWADDHNGDTDIILFQLAGLGDQIKIHEENDSTPAAARERTVNTGDATSAKRRHVIGFNQDAVANRIDIYLDGTLAASQFFYGGVIDFDYTAAGFTQFGATMSTATVRWQELFIFDHCLTANQWAALAATAGIDLEGQTGDERLHQILDSLPGTSRRDFPAVTRQLVHATISGVDDVDDVANGEHGLAFPNLDGSWLLRPRADLDGQATAGEWGNQLLSRTGPTAAVEFTVVDPLSLVTVTRPGLYGARSVNDVRGTNELTVATFLLDDADAEQLADDIAAARATDRMLVRSVTIQPRVNNQWDVVLPLKQGDKVRFAAIPLAAPATPLMDMTALVSRVNHVQKAMLDWESTIEVLLV